MNFDYTLLIGPVVAAGLSWILKSMLARRKWGKLIIELHEERQAAEANEKRLCQYETARIQDQQRLDQQHDELVNCRLAMLQKNAAYDELARKYHSHGCEECGRRQELIDSRGKALQEKTAEVEALQRQSRADLLCLQGVSEARDQLCQQQESMLEGHQRAIELLQGHLANKDNEINTERQHRLAAEAVVGELQQTLQAKDVQIAEYENVIGIRNAKIEEWHDRYLRLAESFSNIKEEVDAEEVPV